MPLLAALTVVPKGLAISRALLPFLGLKLRITLPCVGQFQLCPSFLRVLSETNLGSGLGFGGAALTGTGCVAAGTVAVGVGDATMMGAGFVVAGTGVGGMAVAPLLLTGPLVDPRGMGDRGNGGNPLAVGAVGAPATTGAVAGADGTEGLTAGLSTTSQPPEDVPDVAGGGTEPP